MERHTKGSVLQRALIADAVISGGTGLLMGIGATLLAPVLALPEPLLRYAGIMLLPFAAFVAFVALRAAIVPGLAWLVIGLNSVWVLASIGLLISGFVTPNLFGYSFVVVQALVVAVFAEWQWFALRRSPMQTA
ncbi:hypothetical protein HC891_04655 [Candidatus Gracilibacteria bacterium]|nr:hypothetical protein [Candidatus Gracilibacteria bacterium]